MYFISYNDESNKIAMTVTGTSFPRHRDYAIDYVPNPTLNADQNGLIEFRSGEPGFCNVDWGDGTSGQYAFVKHRDSANYRLMFRALNVEWKKDPDAVPRWFFKGDGTEYTPVPPHVYTDGKETHTVVFDFTGNVTFFESYLVYMDEFPILDAPGLVSLNIHGVKCVNPNIPFDKIGRSVKIQTFSVNDLLSTITGGIPEAIFKLKDLRVLNLERLLVLPETESSNIRRLSELTKLTSITLNSCGVRKYVKEFNDLPNLTSLGIAGCRYENEGFDVNTMPDFSEVESINPSINSLTFIDYDSYTSSNNWHEFISGKGIQYLTRLNCAYCRNTPVDILPEYWREMRSLTTFDLVYALRSQDRADTFVNNFYSYVQNWDLITRNGIATDGERNQFYGLTVLIYAALSPNSSYRPSGVYQAPDGFLSGTGDGNPQTPMEKIYVLVNNYKQNWILKPEATTSSSVAARSARPFEMVFVDGRAIIGDGDLITSFPKEYCYSEEEAVSLCKDHGVDEKPVIEWFENRGAGIPED